MEKKELSAQDKYDRDNTIRYSLKFNKNTDSDILAYLEQAENKQGFIKESIRVAIEKVLSEKRLKAFYGALDAKDEFTDSSPEEVDALIEEMVKDENYDKNA